MSNKTNLDLEKDRLLSKDNCRRENVRSLEVSMVGHTGEGSALLGRRKQD